jgi:hypothetical protein
MINIRLQIFRPSTTSRQKVNVMLIDLQKYDKSATISPVMDARSTSSQFQGISIEKHINSYLQCHVKMQNGYQFPRQESQKIVGVPSRERGFFTAEHEEGGVTKGELKVS